MGTARVRDWGIDVDAIGVEARKVQLTGRSTHVISLPKRWVSQSGLQTGDVVMWVPRPDGALNLTVGNRRTVVSRLRGVVHGADLGEEALLQHLAAFYSSGCDTIEVQGIRPGSNPVITRLISRLSGASLVEARPDGVTVGVHVDVTEFRSGQGLSRLLSLARELHLRGFEMWSGGERSIGAGALHEEAARVYWLLSRQASLVSRDMFIAGRASLTSPQAMRVARAADLLHGVVADTSIYSRPWSTEGRLQPVLDSVATELEWMLDRIDAALRTFLGVLEGNRPKALPATQGSDLIRRVMMLDASETERFALMGVADSIARGRRCAQEMADEALRLHSDRSIE